MVKTCPMAFYRILALFFLCILPEYAFAQADSSVLQMLEELRVVPEDRCEPYNSRQYRYSQSVEDVIIDQNGLYGPYSGQWFDNKRQTDIEHIVARSEAHDSGLCAANRETKRYFASDLENLTLASPSVNRHQKVDKDVSEWLPEKNACWFVAQTIKVRIKYNLTIDSKEKEATEKVVSNCDSFDMVVFSESGQPTQSTKNYRNCTELRQDYPDGVRRGHPAYQSSMDRDNDGYACE